MHTTARLTHTMREINLPQNISIEDVYAPKIYGDGQDLAYCLSQQLLYLFQLYRRHNIESWETPTLRELAEQFECTHIDVLQAFQMLRQYGFDYDIHGVDSPIEWHPCTQRSVARKERRADT